MFSFVFFGFGFFSFLVSNMFVNWEIYKDKGNEKANGNLQCKAKRKILNQSVPLFIRQKRSQR